MKKIILGALLAAFTTTTFAHPENYIMDCGAHKRVVLFLHHNVKPLMLVDKKDYMAIMDVGQANTDNYTFGEIIKEINKNGEYDKVSIYGALTIETSGEGINRQIHLIDM